MKIHGTDPFQRLKDLLDKIDEPSRRDAARTSGPRETRETAGGADAVQLSLRAREMARLKDELLTTPEIRQQLVDSLRAELASGRYRIDGTRIADELLREAGEGEREES